jgi:iron complex outermembrane receptor protein
MINKILFFLIIFSINGIWAQQDSLNLIKLEPVILNVSRISESLENLPISLSRLDFIEKQDLKQQLSFNEYLYNVPGLFALNANNYSQDLRISIRGFGARSAFGIRGIKIIVDGIPETTPDGQGQVDNLNLSIIKSLEIIRGPSSTLYGNASGGVISINTIDDFDENFAKAGLTFGSYDMQQYQLAFGLKSKKTNYLFHGNKIKTNGFREQSGFENYNFNFKIHHRFSASSKFSVLLNYTDSPVAEDSGGLTTEEVVENREQARQRNVDFKTAESIKQFKIGTHFTYQSNKMIFSTYGFYSFRDFYGLLPFEDGGIVNLDRNYFGNGSNFTFTNKNSNHTNKFQIGYDFAIQQDKRLRFRNLEGIEGEKSFDQKESFTSFGFFALDHYSFRDLLVRFGIRYDRNYLKATDMFIADGNGTGEIFFNSFNPSIGLNYNLNAQNYLYANFSTSFETPALSELSANPSGDGGLNEELKAQSARNFELGYKFKRKNTFAQITLFYIETDNDLVPYELENFPDRIFFRNAGSSKRRGLELFYSQDLVKNFKLKTSYTYSDFRYSAYETSSGNFNGKYLPGIPKHLATFSVDYQNKSGLTLSLQSKHVGDLYTNDSNSVRDDHYSLYNLNVGFKIKSKQILLLPFLGIKNVFDTKYNDNIRINAFGGRYYEPAPGFNIFGGIRAQL